MNLKPQKTTAKWIKKYALSIGFLASLTVIIGSVFAVYFYLESTFMKIDIGPTGQNNKLDLEIVKCDNSKGVNQNGCIAYCPTEKIIISGGCSASGSQNNYAQVFESIPIENLNGWKCYVSVDKTEHRAKSAVTGYAICGLKDEVQLIKGPGF